MGKFIIGTFLLLGGTFYELSGGAGFEPETRNVAATEGVTDANAQAANYVPFSEPNVTTSSIPAAPTSEFEVIQASFEPSPAVAVQTAEAIVEKVVATEAAPAPLDDTWIVAGDRVNMRSGPSTDYDVLDTLPRGTKAELIETNTSGWARIRLLETNQIGWMAERLLTES